MMRRIMIKKEVIFIFLIYESLLMMSGDFDIC